MSRDEGSVLPLRKAVARAVYMLFALRRIILWHHSCARGDLAEKPRRLLRFGLFSLVLPLVSA